MPKAFCPELKSAITAPIRAPKGTMGGFLKVLPAKSNYSTKWFLWKFSAHFKTKIFCTTDIKFLSFLLYRQDDVDETKC